MLIFQDLEASTQSARIRTGVNEMMTRFVPEAPETLFQASVFALPVPIQGLAGATAGSPEPTPAQVEATQRTVRPLIDSSLLTPLDNGRVWVHRWTAQHLKTRMGDATFRACCQRAGEYLLVSRTLGDAVEAVRCFLEAQAFDRATDVAEAILDFMGRYGQLADVAAFAAEVLAALPPAHPRYAHLCVYEADALMQLGATRKAFERYQEAMTILKSRVEAEPDRADYQRDLSVSYNKLGDLLRALGQGEQARQSYQQALEIRQRLAEAEPDRADYQRDLSVSYNKLGDLHRALGQGEAARQYYQQPWRLPAAGRGRTRPRRLPARSVGLLQQAGRPAPGSGPRGGGAPVLPTDPGDSPAAGRSRTRPRRLPMGPGCFSSPDGSRGTRQQYRASYSRVGNSP